MQAANPWMPASRRIFAALPRVALVAAWLALLLPAAIYSEWFTLDIGGMWTRAQDFPANLEWALSPASLGGRFFPAYWFFNFALFGALGTHIAAHFAVQSLLFIASLAITCRLLFQLTGSWRSTLAFGVIACLGGAVTENMYTIGKAEPLAYFFIIVALAISRTVVSGERGGAGWRLGMAALLVTLAMWSKETSLVTLALPVAALAAALYVARGRVRELMALPESVRYLWLLAAIAAGILVARAPYIVGMHGGASHSYVDYTIDAELVLGNLGFYLGQQPDVAAFGLAAVALCFIALRRSRAKGCNEALPARSDLVFVCGMLAMAWGYYAGLLIWRWPMGYYMLLPSIFFKFAAIFGFARLAADRPPGTMARAAATVGALVAVAYAALHSFYVATSQIAYSRMYTEAISRYVALSRPDNRLIIESFPFYAEQVTNTRQVIALMTGQPRVVGGIADLLDPSVVTPEIVKLLGITPAQLRNNEKALPHEGDFVLAMTGNKLATWFVRGVAPYFRETSILRKEGAFDMIPVAEDRSFTPSAFLHTWTYQIYSGPTYIGYTLYRVTSPRPRILWHGLYPDGWMGKSASIRVYPEYGPKVRIRASTPPFNSPNELTVTRDGRKLLELPLVAGKEVTFDIDTRTGSVPARIDFDVAHTVVPKKLKVNKDERHIGILIETEPE